MKIIVDSKDNVQITIDTKNCEHLYQIKNAMKEGLRLDGLEESSIAEIFRESPDKKMVDPKSEGAKDNIFNWHSFTPGFQLLSDPNLDTKLQHLKKIGLHMYDGKEEFLKSVKEKNYFVELDPEATYEVPHTYAGDVLIPGVTRMTGADIFVKFSPIDWSKPGFLTKVEPEAQPDKVHKKRARKPKKKTFTFTLEENDVTVKFQVVDEQVEEIWVEDPGKAGIYTVLGYKDLMGILNRVQSSLDKK